MARFSGTVDCTEYFVNRRLTSIDLSLSPLSPTPTSMRPSSSSTALYSMYFMYFTSYVPRRIQIVENVRPSLTCVFSSRSHKSSRMSVHFTSLHRRPKKPGRMTAFSTHYDRIIPSLSSPPIRTPHYNMGSRHLRREASPRGLRRRTRPRRPRRLYSLST